MKRITLTLIYLLFIASLVTANPVKKTIQAGGFMREYLVYMPQHPQAAFPTGLLIGLHGFNGSMDDFFNAYDFRTIADSLNYLILAPMALPEQNEAVKLKADVLSLFMGDQLKLDAVWACGLKVRAVMLGITLIDDELNKDIDDTGFLSLMIQQTIAEYALSPDNIFMIGTSMGGYMAYQYALIQPVKLSGMVAVAGSMGLAIKDQTTAPKVPVCDFHSLTDEVVPYTGSYNQSGATIYLAQNKADVIQFWATNNATGAPVIENVDYYPAANNITVEKITYPAPVFEVIHYRINGAYHNYFLKKEEGDCMDHREEITKFIVAHATTSPSGTLYPQLPDITVYPNPARDMIYLGVATGDVTIYNPMGQTVWSGAFHAGSLNISFLKPGMYILHIQTEGRTKVAKITVSN